MDDAWARQMEIMEIIFSQNYYLMVYIFVHQFYLKHPHLSVLRSVGLLSWYFSDD